VRHAIAARRLRRHAPALTIACAATEDCRGMGVAGTERMNKTATLAVVMLVAACQRPGLDPPVSEVARAAGPYDDPGVFGERVNGRSLGGEDGPELYGVEYTPVSLNGGPVNDVTIVHGHLLGRRPNGTPVVDGAWAGATLRGRALDGAVVPLRIDAVTVPGPNMHLYSVSRQRPGPSLAPEWVPLCEPGPDGSTQAIPLAARWDRKNGDRVPSSTHFTFACPSGAINKCIRLGYGPWLNAEVMEGAHQACTRAFRMDVCGDGRPLTVDGTPIHIYDRLDQPVQAQLFDREFFEAGWTPDGAFCLSHLRWDFLRPACAARAEPGIARGPFVRDSDGWQVAGRTCDDPEEALAAGAPMSVFTESVPQGIEDLPENPGF
jgi:hypothetical protein